MSAPIIPHAEWLERRAAVSLTASDWYKAESETLSLWAQKRGLMPRPEFTDPAVESGRALEGAILRIGCRRLGLRWLDPFSEADRTSAEEAVSRLSIASGRTSAIQAWVQEEVEGEARRQPWVVTECKRFGCTLDGMATDAAKEHVYAVEAKNRREWFKKLFDDEDPDQLQPSVYSQVGAQLLISGLDGVALIPLLGGWKWCERLILRESMPLEQIEKIGEWFAGKLASDVPPKPLGSDADAAAIKALFPKDLGTTIDLDETDEKRWARCWELKLAIKQREEELEALKQILEMRIGSNTYAKLPGGKYLSLKTKTIREHIRHESSSRSLAECKGPK